MGTIRKNYKINRAKKQTKQIKNIHSKELTQIIKQKSSDK